MEKQMTPEERQLVTGLFDRMRNYSLPEKDGEAEALIKERVRAQPDAPYMLVQSVLVQEQALQEADSRIKALEEQARALEAQQRPAGSGSFLGGLFGSRPTAEPPRGPSVPVVGARATPSTYAGAQPGTPGPTPPPAASPWSAAAPGGGGGSFLRTALATAAGVAGGVLVAGAIRDLMSPAHAGNTNPGAAGSGTGQDASTASGEIPKTEPVQDTPPTQAVDEDSSWFGGDGGGDFEL
jgi:uncharacterized protein